MFRAEIVEPASGAWSVQFHGAGRYQLTVHAHRRRGDGDALITFDDFDFVRRGGRPGHEGWFPLDETPTDDTDAACSAAIDGAWETATFAFVDEEGQQLSSLALERLSPDDGEFLGRCRVPDQPFRVRVTGTDAGGKPFMRTLAARYPIRPTP